MPALDLDPEEFLAALYAEQPAPATCCGKCHESFAEPSAADAALGREHRSRRSNSVDCLWCEDLVAVLSKSPQGQKLLSYESDKSEWTLILSAFLSFVIEQQSSSGITIVALEARLRTLKMVFLHGAKVQKELSSSFAGSSRAEVEEDADILEAFFNECEDQQDGVQPSVEAPRPKADEGLPAESKGGADLGAVGGASHIEPGTSPGGLGLSSEHTKDGSDLQESPCPSSRKSSSTC